MSSVRHCAVTGSTGYVGSRICEYFAARGWTIFELTRRHGRVAPNRVNVPFQLDGPIDAAVFRNRGISTLIHCAYDFRPTKWADIQRINVAGSIRLLQAAKEGGVSTIVVVSSISAFSGCTSLYGKAKLAIEAGAAGLGAFIVRPGLVYGKARSGGVFGSLQRVAAHSPIIPLIGSGRYPQYLVHEEDLCELMLQICEGLVAFTPRPLVAAGRRPWQIRDLLRVMRGDLAVRFVPVPWPIVWTGLKLLELCGIDAPFRSDSVISLVRQNPAPDFSAAMESGCRFREFSEGFAGLHAC